MKIAVFGNYGVHNLGDDLILEGFLNQYENDEVVVFCGYPKQVKQQFSIDAHQFFPGGFRSLLKYWFNSEYRQEVKTAQHVLRDCDKVFVGGGGILVDRHFKALYLWRAQLAEIKKSKKSYHFISNSLELRTKRSQRLFKPFLQSAVSISVRDKASQDLLSRMGIESKLVEDLALSSSSIKKFALGFRTRAHHITPNSRLQSGDMEPVVALFKIPTISLALNRWMLDTSRLHILREFITKKQSEGYQVKALAFQTVGDDDREVYQELGLNVPILTKINDILTTLQSSGILIGMRFHAILLSLHFKVPVIALPYQSKVTALMTERGLSDHLIPLPDLNQQKLQDLFEKLVDEKPVGH
ncbi:MAG: polysaccharide pyruvyl transferase family protein [Candidatus Gracilibacteria bacterium]|nr:polysaccharide pyruvyl transferase family protein [Candidatus Gracilibacteria bacterium]